MIQAAASTIPDSTSTVTSMPAEMPSAIQLVSFRYRQAQGSDGALRATYTALPHGDKTRYQHLEDTWMHDDRSLRVSTMQVLLLVPLARHHGRSCAG